MNIEIKEINYETKLISLDGELDNTTINKVEKIIDPLIEEINLSYLIFDLSKLTYLNSTGLSKLLQYQINLRSKKGGLKIFGITTFVHEIMGVCGALKILEVHKTKQEAMESLGL